MERQPAVKSYFFGKGYRQLFGTIADAWSGNEQSACRVREKIKLLLKYHSSGSVMRWIDRIIVLFKLLELFSIYFFGTIASAAFSLIHMLIVFSVMLGVYIMFALIWTADRGYILIKGIFGACPKCKGKYKMPVYVCDCGAEHTRLTPGIYGILRRKCLCGNKLPTTFFNGRRLLASKCPCCGSVLSSREAVPVCIPAIGGPSVGKTCFITALMKELTENACPLKNMRLSFYDYRNRAECGQMIEKYNRGVLQTKTADTNPAAFNFFVSGRGIRPERLMYIYDIAGEAFGMTDALASQKQYEYCHGFIFLIDPLTIADVRNRHKADAEFKNYNAGVEDIDDTFDVFLSNLKRISGLSANKLSRVPCAIVINKVDAFDLNEKIGIAAAERAMTEQPGGFKDVRSAESELVRRFLIENGMNNFINNIELCFKKKRYFSCSAIGHTQNGKKFEPVGVFEPFTWIVSNFDKKLGSRFSAYADGDIRIKFPRRSMKLADGKKYAVLSWMNYNDGRYFCLAERGSDGRICADEARVFYAPKGKIKNISETDVGGDSEQNRIIRHRLELDEWNIRLKYYNEKTADKQNSGKENDK